MSLIGTWMQTVAQSWLVLQLTGSATAVGVVVALESLPVLLLAPYGGVVADRLDKRRLLIRLHSGTGVLALILAVLTVTGRVTLWHVYVLALLLGLGKSFESPARQSFVLEIVGPDRLRNAVSLNGVLVNVARTVGPAVAGVVIAAGGTVVYFFLNAASTRPASPPWSSACSAWMPGACNRPRGPPGQAAAAGGGAVRPPDAGRRTSPSRCS